MKKLYGTKPKHAYAALGTLLFVATFSAPASAEDAAATAYTMTVISDQAFGMKVTSGKYDQAIEKITARGIRAADKFASQNNLCVAYAKTNDIQKANAACNAAIKHVEKRERRMIRHYDERSTEVRALRSNMAVALSNRGVLLAVTGDTELAKANFLAAIDLETRHSSIIEGNLKRLQKG